MPIDYGKGARLVQVFTVPGVLAVGARPARWQIQFAMRVVEVRTAVGTAPTGSTILVDVNKNGTTIFTTQGNRPSIAISGFLSAAAVPDAAAAAYVAGDYVTVEIDQKGSTIAGSDLTVAIEYVQTGA